ncbi:MAG: ATP-binding protein [Planctomycetes bacterium]|nr:ATP-binding protein [Planctomycetota bacterium]
MGDDEQGNAVHIRPRVGMYGAFSRLNYKPWYAIAEFVDNAIQSFLDNADALARADKSKEPGLAVRIRVEPNRITIADNAAGIRWRDFPRAFSPATPPPNTGGLSEFGLGMKAAACWFARSWSVTTSALNDPKERVIRFDVPKIVQNGIEEVEVEERKAERDRHFTTLVLEDLNVPLKGGTVVRVRQHLASIYRRFLSSGQVVITYGDDDLTFEKPAVLVAPSHDDAKGKPRTWRKDITIELGHGRRVTGWAALRAKASTADAGFAVFRRNRLILGSLDGSYRPEAIFRKPNSFTYQRLFGELEVEGFQVSHTKDGIQWDDFEEQILTELKRQVDAKPMALIQQAENFRARGGRGDRPRDWGDRAVKGAAAALERHAPPVITRQLGDAATTAPPKTKLPAVEVDVSREVKFEIEHERRHWEVGLELVNDPSELDWYSFSQEKAREKGEATQIRIRVNLAHPFSERFALLDEDELEPLLRLAAGLTIAEITARESGASGVPTLRRNLNQLLRDALGNA